MNDLIFIMLLAAIPAAFNFFLDYCLGKPMSKEPSTKAILSSYSLNIATERLKKLSLLNNLVLQFKEQLNDGSEATRLDGKDQLNLVILLTAQKYFTWEQAVGMCPFCTNFWVSLFSAGVMFFTVPLSVIHPLFLFLLIPIFSHLILRKL